MRITADDLRRHYASLSDAELLDLDRSELAGMAQGIYDEEISRRRLNGPPEEGPCDGDPVDDIEAAAGDAGPDSGDGPPPDWLEDAACPWSVLMRGRVMGHSEDYASEAARVRAVLRQAGIPSHVVVKPPDTEPPPPVQRPSEYCVMVPGDLNMQAATIIEREIFNPQHEEEWRNHLQALSDEQLRALKLEDFCSALLDRAERLKRAYLDEIARRKPQASGR